MFTRFLEYLERLPFGFGNFLYVRFPSLDVNREQPPEELPLSQVPHDVQAEAMERMRERRMARKGD